MNKFQVGDHVKGNKGYAYENLIDAEVSVIVDEDRMWIKLLRFLDGDTKQVGTEACVYTKYFELVNKNQQEPKENKHNDFLDSFRYGVHFYAEPVCRRSIDSSVLYRPFTVASFVINGEEYTNEQYVKDAARFVEDFPNDKHIELSHAIEYVLIVHQYAKDNPTNLEHYAAELGWDKEQSDFVYFGVCPIPYTNYETCPKRISGGEFTCKKCRKWWDQTWKGAECTIR